MTDPGDMPGCRLLVCRGRLGTSSPSRLLRHHERIRHAEAVYGQQTEDARGHHVVHGWNNGHAQRSSLLSEKPDGCRSGDNIMNGNHIAGRGADGLQGNHGCP